MALSPEEIRREIEDIGTDLPQNLGDAIDRAASTVVQQVKQRAPADSGALRDSIRAQFETDNLTLGISMLDYGYFQNYGVVGTKNEKLQLGVPEPVSDVLPPRQAEKYSFNKNKTMIGGDLPFGVRKSIHQKGLSAKQFLDLESFVERVSGLVNENLEI